MRGSVVVHFLIGPGCGGTANRRDNGNTRFAVTASTTGPTFSRDYTEIGGGTSFQIGGKGLFLICSYHLLRIKDRIRPEYLRGNARKPLRAGLIREVQSSI